MIFPKLIAESIVQVGDMTRLFMGKSFTTPEEGAITKVEISFDNATFIDVFESGYHERWYLDYSFGAEVESQDIYVKISTASDSTTETYTIRVISKANDALFSDDSMILALETEFIGYIPRGRSSFNYAHRKAQEIIARYLDGEGFRDIDSKPFTNAELSVNTYIQEWATYQTIVLILEDISSKDSDAFTAKLNRYYGKLSSAIKNAPIRLDYNKDGEIEDTEVKNTQNKFLSR